MKWEGLGYHGAVFDYHVKAVRTEVAVSSLQTEEPFVYTFRSFSPFNKIRDTPVNLSYNDVSG